LRAYLYDAARVDEAIYRQKQAAKKKKRWGWRVARR
jgi:hypothetical protein